MGNRLATVKNEISSASPLTFFSKSRAWRRRAILDAAAQVEIVRIEPRLNPRSSAQVSTTILYKTVQPDFL
jgi:hypothetical protein